MSAYIVPNETIQIIAAWANRSEQGIVNYAEAEEAAKILFTENARSVAFRYSDSQAARPLVSQPPQPEVCVLRPCHLHAPGTSQPAVPEAFPSAAALYERSST